MKRETLSSSVKKQIRDDIYAGHFAETGKLPPEDELCKKYGASRTTIRSALQNLEHDGVISIRHGAGSFIRTNGFDMRLRLDVFESFYALIEQCGRKASMKNCGVKQITLPDAIAKKMQVKEGSDALKLDREFCGDGEPIIVVTEYIPTMRIANDAALEMIIERPEAIPESIVKFTDIFCKSTVENSLTEISTVAKGNTPNAIADKLRIAESMLRLEELLFDAEGTAVVYSDVYVDDKIIRFQVYNRRNA